MSIQIRKRYARNSFSQMDKAGRRYAPIVRYFDRLLAADARKRGARARALAAVAEKFSKDVRTVERILATHREMVRSCDSIRDLLRSMRPRLLAIAAELFTAEEVGHLRRLPDALIESILLDRYHAQQWRKHRQEFANGKHSRR